eukprot:Plantae.Rhodophyta-Hildenbrandia_rubra.ctg5991.p1 GENE.Plantae.Rhodophyta-Hildenbrandia_rubra.ctg5991~~Plantae.Rhodophyta-Hildenbrandia_rubra.ctg5991.p1  ORF type:complete len:198 (+),score=55.41 Plantae.Rhodophyta-Hildenbrandia_rubra.ctg5991:804-1397(+)
MNRNQDTTPAPPGGGQLPSQSVDNHPTSGQSQASPFSPFGHVHDDEFTVVGTPLAAKPRLTEPKFRSQSSLDGIRKNNGVVGKVGGEGGGAGGANGVYSPLAPSRGDDGKKLEEEKEDGEDGKGEGEEILQYNGMMGSVRGGSLNPNGSLHSHNGFSSPLRQSKLRPGITPVKSPALRGNPAAPKGWKYGEAQDPVK